MVSNSLIIASEVTGFVSFFFTLLTWLGVYISLLTTFRSAPRAIPLVLGNLRQELQSERSMLRQRIKEGDRYHVFHGRQLRRTGRNESHIKLAEQTLKTTWKEFRNLERRFIVHDDRDIGEVEDVRSDDEDSGFSDVEKERRNGNGWQDEKAAVGARIRDARRMRRRESHIKSRMGMVDAGLSIDRHTYYNTNLRHRILWWWKQDDVNSLANRIQRLQIRRIERDLYETDELMKRGLAILGGMSGEDVYDNCGEGPPRKPRDGGGTRRKRTRHARSSRAPSRSASQKGGNASRAGVREVYEREIRRVRRRSQSGSSTSPSPAPSRATRAAGSTVSMSRRTEPVSRSRAPSVVEYEVVNPGRIWVDVEESPRSGAREMNAGRRMSRPSPAHFQSYVRERDHSPSSSR